MIFLVWCTNHVTIVSLATVYYVGYIENSVILKTYETFISDK